MRLTYLLKRQHFQTSHWKNIVNTDPGNNSKVEYKGESYEIINMLTTKLQEHKEAANTLKNIQNSSLSSALDTGEAHVNL